jgi:hypothetical protein
MKAGSWLLIFLLLVSGILLPLSLFYRPPNDITSQGDDKVFFGVTFGGNSTDEAKRLIDKVKGYTNLFIVDNWDVTMHEEPLNEICDYAVDAGLSIIVYFNFIFINATRYTGLFEDFALIPFHIQWLSTARERWGDKFLGVYLYDEPGGKQIDAGYYTGNATTRTGARVRTFDNVANYSDAAYKYVRSVGLSGSMQQLINNNYPYTVANTTYGKMPVFTADNTLYWFDYLSNYDVVFAEFGWNHNQAQHIALCRGAANVQNKQWGVIITWAQNEPPYLASGKDMLQGMLTAYRTGAKYVVVFNYPQINDYGALTEEHFAAMKTFWNFIHLNPRGTINTEDAQVALVLPKDYGWGMRTADDKIWGFWAADENASIIGESAVKLLQKYGLKLDIIYDDPQFNYTGKYKQVYFWNSTID